jgi:hypothetical protein
MYVTFSVFCVLFVCICVLYYYHQVSTQLQLNIYIMYRIIYNSRMISLPWIFILYIDFGVLRHMKGHRDEI